MNYSHSPLQRRAWLWPITRRFIFRDKIDPLLLPDIKLVTNSIEEELSADEENIIDPGMTLPFVLASTKPFPQDISGGI